MASEEPDARDWYGCRGDSLGDSLRLELSRLILIAAFEFASDLAFCCPFAGVLSKREGIAWRSSEEPSC